MFGRFIGLIAGFALLGEGYVLWRPEIISTLATPELGPFAPYQKLVAILAIAIGVAVLIAAVLRTPERRRKAAVGGIDWDAPAPAAAVIDPEPISSPLVADAPVEVDPPPPDPFPAAEPAPPPAEPAATVVAADAIEVDHELVAPPAAPALSGPEPLPALPASADDEGRLRAATAAGDQLRAEDRLSDAIDPYTEALALARSRHAAAPQDPDRSRDLAHAITNVADVHDRDGRLDAALDLHEESLGLRRTLAAGSPDDVAAQRDLSIGLERLADTREARGHRSRARDLFRERLTLAERLAGSAPDDRDLAKDLDTTRERLFELDEALTI